MKVWITRPSSREVFMGGVRDLKLWIEQPAYHHTKTEDYNTLTETVKYVEHGWRALHQDHGISAKYWLKQSPALQSIIWSLTIHSISPKLEDEHKWAADFDRYQRDTFEGDWEGKCKIPAKRFLVEIDLSQECDQANIVVPQIYSVDDNHILGYDLNLTQSVYTTFLDNEGTIPYDFNK